MDLDLQGSLSSMILGSSEIKRLYDERQLAQNFLNSASHSRGANLLEYVQPIFDGTNCGIVATSDKLAYAEMNLTMSWLLRIGKRDSRFLLRKALHQRRVLNKFDIILLDCPPLINTCCVNALAASDFVLIPTTPGKKSAERVPLLLESIKRFHVHVNPDLQVAGVLFNRTHGSQLTAAEMDQWQQLLVQGQDRMGSPIYGFQTIIRHQPREIRQMESDGAYLQPGGELFDAFRRLAEELEGRLPRECRRIADSSYQSQ